MSDDNIFHNIIKIISRIPVTTFKEFKEALPPELQEEVELTKDAKMSSF
jgi:hypothetical protein